jgi:tetratricopeptide (TPR) repeat protein
MSVASQKHYETLLKNGDFHSLLIELEGQDDPYHQFLKGIAHYKLNQAEKANVYFEAVNKTNPSNEVSAYLIITKLKLNDIISASKLYNALCFEENKAILKDIHSRNYNQAISRCLFLQSIPVERPQLAPGDTLQSDVTNSNYTAALLKLHELNGSSKSCECC